ncbi:hypothetical protein [Alcaligenes faecalis]|uniref:hypothetical protein n=1 Tax=Alcaligenes faecalis TaxID=511 RepID=UPI0015E8138D|nr:hypothetical protein [Alcaligenes faecalis]
MTGAAQRGWPLHPDKRTLRPVISAGITMLTILNLMSDVLVYPCWEGTPRDSLTSRRSRNQKLSFVTKTSYFFLEGRGKTGGFAPQGQGLREGLPAAKYAAFVMKTSPRKGKACARVWGTQAPQWCDVFLMALPYAPYSFLLIFFGPDKQHGPGNCTS